MPPIRLFLFLANSFTFLPFSQSFLIASADRHIQFCYFRFKTHTMPLSPSSIVDFVDDNSQDGANIDTRAFPLDPNSSSTSTERGIQEHDDLIRVAVLGTGMMGQVRFEFAAVGGDGALVSQFIFPFFRQTVACYMYPRIAINLTLLFPPSLNRSGTLLLHIWLSQSSN